VDRPAGRAKRLGRVADVLKPAPTFARHKCRDRSVLPISSLFSIFVRQYRIYTLLHFRATLSFWGSGGNFGGDFSLVQTPAAKKGGMVGH
jgi:hypothetical protein